MTVLQPTPRLQQAAFWMTGVVLWSFWNVGTLVGALAGGAIDPETFGLDVAFPAAFVAMVWPQLRTRRGALAAGIGAAICRSEEHTSELQSLMRISYAVFCFKKYLHLHFSFFIFFSS